MRFGLYIYINSRTVVSHLYNTLLPLLVIAPANGVVRRCPVALVYPATATGYRTVVPEFRYGLCLSSGSSRRNGEKPIHKPDRRACNHDGQGLGHVPEDR